MSSNRSIAFAIFGLSIGVLGVALSLFGLAIVVEGSTNINIYPLLGVGVALVGVVVSLTYAINTRDTNT
jgi:hypothetical protein